MDRARDSCEARSALERFMELNRVYAFDAVIVSLSLSVFDFARYTGTKGEPSRCRSPR
ncbi:MAG: hypothetical protein LBR80_04980 [Deltaproteobacteria bacterium]|jgi:hypothetical protein|nr:hypothetical protein [Deltaproteobacteria bacterium]